MLQHIRKTGSILASIQAPTSAYDAALSHSSRVSRLKILLPVAAGLISLGFIGVAIVRTYLPENLSIESAKIEDGKIVMERPAISGRNSDGISYSMLANKALQDIQNPNKITLKDVKAAVPINDDLIARVTATSADFDRGADVLDLTAPFDVNLSNGITAHFQSAHLDIPGGTMNTPDAVNISMSQGSIVADSMKITDKGHTLNFTGKVRVHLDPAAIRNKGK
ncbi:MULTISPECIES: LPS export ABC transporter periplasmic protein LptC [Rhizobium]|jgi:lipopolysaccharide export system protein LptC|uniref:Lipopolysaccharide export system protein LptC n=1 Tax=Rhizobium wenxiniae TaxID=1737357 RepID=A0A7W9Y6Y6_9HYPH|nr:LPS export ABC transporter periplasmic protein LptC [Rhizobium wenxiniae]MBB6162967.1 lipopolysaccharide export system protein LptC [Rhizobium wenxiniae]GGF94362.1 membrane protein [Rhizobium wenxiniae]